MDENVAQTFMSYSRKMRVSSTILLIWTAVRSGLCWRAKLSRL